MKHGEFYTVKRLRLLEALLKKGFEPVAAIPDPTNYKYNWWQFKNSVELEAAIEEYFNGLKKQGA